MMKQLTEHFITSSQPYVEGAVFHFTQPFRADAYRQATISITALGVYETSINGHKVGTQMFAPGFTYYHNDLYYQVHDITALLTHGENRLEVYLAQGWYCGRFTYNNKCQIYGDQAAVSWAIELTCVDSSKQVFTSDESVVELESPYDYAGFYDGEIYHAGRNTRETGRAVRYTGKVPLHLSRTTIEVRLQEAMPIKSVTYHGDTTILDFGQNFAGIVSINPVHLREGEVVTLHHGEILARDGSVYTKNLRRAKQRIVYHAGVEKERYLPRFTYMGFRYLAVSGCEYQEGLIAAHALYSEMERTGFFHCDNLMVQRLYENQLWGQKSNYVEVPTDCPQRDERMGYTGDAQVYATTGSFNYNTEVFLAKFLKDMRFSQMDNADGYIGSTAPAMGPGWVSARSMLGWGNAVTRIPEILYWQYGTDEHLRVQYQSMKTFVEMEIDKMGDEDLWISKSLGDWLMPSRDMAWAEHHNNPVSNAFIVHDLEVLTETARRFGYTQDEARYGCQLAQTRTTYIARFVEEEGTMLADYQGAYVIDRKSVV